MIQLALAKGELMFSSDCPSAFTPSLSSMSAAKIISAAPSRYQYRFLPDGLIWAQDLFPYTRS